MATVLTLSQALLILSNVPKPYQNLQGPTEVNLEQLSFVIIAAFTQSSHFRTLGTWK
jgi:hypothetical protein